MKAFPIVSLLGLACAFTSCTQQITTPASSSNTLDPAQTQPGETQVSTSPVYTKPTYGYIATTEHPTIDESTIQRIIHINPNHPSSVRSGKGTEGQPLKTIQAAHGELHNSLKAGIPTKLVIAPGVYRENLQYLLRIPKRRDREAQKHSPGGGRRRKRRGRHQGLI